jgi:putative transposase
MPYRKFPIITGEMYHVFNRSVARQPIFLQTRDFERAINLIQYYRYFRPPLRFSHFNRLSIEQKNTILSNLINNGECHITIFAFCLMSNHFHFLLKEEQEGGISTFMRNFQNSYGKYFNTKYDRSGSVFQAMFKAIRIETDEQFLQVTRYVHLNPYTAHLVKTIYKLEEYSWSSFPLYLQPNNETFIDTNFTLQMFPSLHAFLQFTYDQANYQRQLSKIKHLTFE